MGRLYKLILLFAFLFSLSSVAAAELPPPSIMQYNQHSPVNYPLPREQVKVSGKQYPGKEYPRKEYSSEEYSNVPMIVESARNLPNFSTISVSDDVDVIVTGGGRQSVTLVGDIEAVENISTEVSEKTLYIKRTNLNKPSKRYDSKVRVKITTNGPIYGLYTQGNSQIVANNIQSSGLTLLMEDDSLIRVNARGVVLRQVVNNSSKNVVMSGINSRDLHLKGTGKGEFILGGTVHNLTAYLYNASCLRAGNLRIQDAYIHTEDQALAIVSPYNALYAFAFDNSNIYYSRTPPKLVQNAENSGNVLKIP